MNSLFTIFLVLLIPPFLLKLSGKNKMWDMICSNIAVRAVYLGFIVSLTATLGSLYFSEIRGFTPCILCWYQRILMYPQTFLFATALYQKSRDIYKYILPISIFGMVLAGYHYYIQLNPNPLVPCSTVGFSVSCSQRFTTNFGYITIPFMSLSAFALITLFMMMLKCFLGKKR